ncbi:MAG: hypothetical protein HZB44_01520 [Actinobacteria bacterium]|nr:hypothetical protein [Actinomycetota bacterium]
MALTKRERYMTIGIVAVLVIAAIAAAYFLGMKSDEDKTSTATTPTATQTTPTATTPTQAQTQSVATVTNVQTITQVEPQPGVGVEIVEQSINPTTVERSGPIALTVRTKGNVNSVKMDINGRAPMVVELVRGPTVNNITTWAAATAAPGLAGNYAYKAIVNASDGAIKEGPNSTFTVLP